MQYKRVYLSKDAITLHKDFEVWYEDGAPFLKFCGKWKNEKSPIEIYGRMGGFMGSIKPDVKALIYYLEIERWEYSFHTLKIFEQYYVKGMRWCIEGSLTDMPLHFKDEDSLENEVTIRFKNTDKHGECIEIYAKDVKKLRIAVVSVVAMSIKEHYKGLSEGITPTDMNIANRIKRFVFGNKAIPYNEAEDK